MNCHDIAMLLHHYFSDITRHNQCALHRLLPIIEGKSLYFEFSPKCLNILPMGAAKKEEKKKKDMNEWHFLMP